MKVTITSPLRQDVQISAPTWTSSKCRPRFMIVYKSRGSHVDEDAPPQPGEDWRYIDLRPWWLRVVELPKRCWWRFQEWIEAQLPRAFD